MGVGGCGWVWGGGGGRGVGGYGGRGVGRYLQSQVSFESMIP